MKLAYANGVTSVILRVKMTASGAAKTGLSSSSAGLIISTIADNEAAVVAYTQAGSTIESITTLGTYAAPTATKCRFKEVDATNHPGLYEIQIADARFAVANARSLIISLSGVSGVDQTDAEVQLSPVPANVTQLLGTAVSSPATAGILDVNVKNMNNVAATSITAVNANQGTTQPVNFTGTAGSALAKSDAIDWASGAIPTPTVAGVPNVNAKTWNDLTTVALPLVPTTAGRTLDVSATGEAGLDWANIGAPTTAVDLSGTTVKNVDNAIASVTLVATTTAVTNDVGITQAGADKVWGSAARTLTSFGTLVADVATAVWGAAARTLTAAADSSGVTTLLTRIAAAITITGGKVDVNDKTGFALTAAYDAAKTAATQASVNAIPTTPLLAANYTAPDNADILLIKAKTDNLPSDPADESLIIAATDAILARLPSALVSGRMDSSIGDITAAALALFITRNTTKTWADVVAGSVAKLIADNGAGGGGGGITVADIFNEDLSTYLAANSAGLLISHAAYEYWSALVASQDDITGGVWNALNANYAISGSQSALLLLASLGGGGGATAQEVWDYLIANWGADTTAGGFIQALLNAIAGKTALITADNFTVASPVNPQTGAFSIVRGDDYTSASGRPLPQWSSTDWTSFSLNTAQSITFYASYRNGSNTLTKACTLLTPTSVEAQLTAAETGALVPGPAVYYFQVRAVLAGGDEVTLVLGTMTVINEVAP